MTFVGIYLVPISILFHENSTACRLLCYLQVIQILYSDLRGGLFIIQNSVCCWIVFGYVRERELLFFTRWRWRKRYGGMAYVSVHRNPVVTQSVPKVGTEVLKLTLGTNWYSSTCGLGTLFVPRVGQYFCVTAAILLAFSSNANIRQLWVHKVCPASDPRYWNSYECCNLNTANCCHGHIPLSLIK